MQLSNFLQQSEKMNGLSPMSNEFFLQKLTHKVKAQYVLKQNVILFTLYLFLSFFWGEGNGAWGDTRWNV